MGLLDKIKQNYDFVLAAVITIILIFFNQFIAPVQINRDLFFQFPAIIIPLVLANLGIFLSGFYSYILDASVRLNLFKGIQNAFAAPISMSMVLFILNLFYFNNATWDSFLLFVKIFLSLYSLLACCMLFEYTLKIAEEWYKKSHREKR